MHRRGLSLTAALLAALLVLRLYFSLFQNALIDDAYITLQYARNLAAHGQWGFYPQLPANTATSPLNVMLTALVTLITRSAVDAALWLAALEGTGILVLLRSLSRRLFGDHYFGALAFAALVANPLLLSTLGLESLLFALLMIASLYAFACKREKLLVASLVLLALTRPDGILLAVVLVAFYPRHRARLAALCLTSLTAWYAISWRFLGGAVPDTLLIKLWQRPWGTWTFGNGPGLYLQVYPLQTAASLLAAPLCFAGLAAKSHAKLPLFKPLVLYAAAYYTAYTALRVPPFHWYYAPVLVCLILLGSLATSALVRSHGPASLVGRLRHLPCALLGGALVISMIQAGGLYPTEAPIHTNWATPEQYRQIGLWLRENTPPDQPIEFEGEIGTLAYYSQRQLLDVFSDPRQVEAGLEEAARGGSALGIFLSLDRAWRTSWPPSQSSSYALIGRTSDRPEAPLRGTVVKAWPISTRWNSGGSVILLRK